jgi:heptosyltransferase I
VSAPSFLIVRLGALGDIVHALPLAAGLREAHPNARIDWLVDTRHAAILDYVDGLTSVVHVDTRRWRGPTGLARVVPALRRRRYDVAIDAQGLLKSAALARVAGARHVIGFARPHLREPQAGWAYRETVAPTGPHVLDKTRALARALGAPIDPLRFGLRPPPTPLVRATRVVMGIAPDAPFVVLNPGAAWPNKRWPEARFAELARAIHTRHGLPSLIVHGPQEGVLAAQITRLAGDPSVVGPAPPTNLGELLAYLAEASLVISGDTGPLHLAAALGRPVVGLFGPTDPARNGPWAAADVTVSRHAVCQCHHARRCEAARWCLDDVSVDEVAAAVARRIEAGIGLGEARR